MDRLNDSIAALVDSYEAYGLINHSGGPNLPSREGIADILRDLEALIFPGFRTSEVLNESSLRFVTAERANRVAQRLLTETEKSISFSCRSGRFACGGGGCRDFAERVIGEFFVELPGIRRMLAMDVDAAFKGDPAAKSVEEVIVSYPGLEAIAAHRLAHFFWTHEVPLIPRMMSEQIHGRTGIDIHPGATIGESFFIDHGTGVVVGETTVIGRNVKLYQGVTLGALSVRKGEADKKRHPTIEDDVTIYAGATILGGKTVIGRGSVIGGNVWVTESVPPDTLVYAKPGEHLLKRKEERA
ncbi:MAG: serine O-acetyltransferase EpsC [Treponemataceae bacterium]